MYLLYGLRFYHHHHCCFYFSTIARAEQVTVTIDDQEPKNWVQNGEKREIDDESEEDVPKEGEEMFIVMGKHVSKDLEDTTPADKFIHHDEDDPAFHDYPKTKIG
jgi:hypothetical protein